MGPYIYEELSSAGFCPYCNKLYGYYAKTVRVLLVVEAVSK